MSDDPKTAKDTIVTSEARELLAAVKRAPTDDPLLADARVLVDLIRAELEARSSISDVLALVNSHPERAWLDLAPIPTQETGDTTTRAQMLTELRSLLSTHAVLRGKDVANVTESEQLRVETLDVRENIRRMHDILIGRGSHYDASQAPGRTPSLLVHSELRRLARADEFLLCLDFGTARSKAAATRGAAGTESIPLAVGKVPGAKEDYDYSVASSVWIDEDDGRIWFGQQAIEASHRHTPPKHLRLDSFKDKLSLARDPRDPRTFDVPNSYNPLHGKYPMNMGELLLLFVGFLTWTAEESLRALGHPTGLVRRRFALPNWKSEKLKHGTELLREYFVRAQLLTDTVGSGWFEGLEIERARDLAREAFAVPSSELANDLVVDGVSEPVAAGAGRLDLHEGNRRLVMIVDVGAGTTDYALQSARERDGTIVVRSISQRANTHAGNWLDEKLRGMILERTKLSSKEHTYQLYQHELMQSQRRYKEDLFRDGKLRVTLGDGRHVVDVTLAEFEESAPVLEFTRQLESDFEETLRGAGLSPNSETLRRGISVVLTGGGAQLRMVQKLASGTCMNATRHAEAALPRGVPENMRDYYPPLAVALGGAMQELPEVGPDVPPIATPTGASVRGAIASDSPGWRSGEH